MQSLDGLASRCYRDVQATLDPAHLRSLPSVDLGKLGPSRTGGSFLGSSSARDGLPDLEAGCPSGLARSADQLAADVASVEQLPFRDQVHPGIRIPIAVIFRMEV